MNEQEMLNALWHFYEKQPDTGCFETAKICAELVLKHGFDIKDLPQRLHDNVFGIIQRHYRECAYDNYFSEDYLYAGCD